MICKFCKKICKNKNSLLNHERLCPKNKDRNYVSGTLGKPAWNRGLTKDTDERVRNNCYSMAKTLRERFKDGTIIAHKHTVEIKKLLSEYAKKQELGGHTSKHRINYVGKYGCLINLHSSYEIKVAEELDKNKVEWIRPEPLLYFDSGNKTHRYYADFYLTLYNVYIDTKNDYLIEKDKEKISRVKEQNNINLLILDKNNLLWENICAGVTQLVE